jgi:hypothetical protein
MVALHPMPGAAAWAVGPSDDTSLIPDMRGLHYLRELLRRPGADIAAVDLSSIVAGHHTTVTETVTVERLDRQALASYRRRLRDIDEELEEALSWSDPMRAERLQDEREALLREISGATGLHGRVRTAAGTAERARVAVRKAIAAALDRIAAEDPGTARLLRTRVRTGTMCRYEPDPDSPVVWKL